MLAPFDLASGTLGDQQVISIKQTDIGRDTYYTELLGAQALHDADVIVEGQAFLNDQDPVRLN